MPALQNLSFEIAGATPGSALGWTRTSQSSVLDIGGVENFESGWSNDGYSPVITSVAVGPTESFESGWRACEAYSPVVTGLAAAVHTAVAPAVIGSPYEDFSDGWGNDTYSPTITSSVTGPAEDFSTGWKGNQNYSPTIVTMATGPTETFESVLLDQEFFLLPGGTTLSAPGHTLTNGIAVYAKSTDLLPAGIPKLTLLYIINAVAGVSFRLSYTVGGSPITPSDSGVGTHWVTGDPAVCWTTMIG